MESINWQTIFGIIENIATIIATFVSILALVIALRANHRAELPQIICYLDFDKEIIKDRFWKHLQKSFITDGIPILIPNSIRSTTIAANPMTDLFDKSSSVTVSYSVKGFLRNRKTNNGRIHFGLFLLLRIALYNKRPAQSPNNSRKNRRRSSRYQ